MGKRLITLLLVLVTFGAPAFAQSAISGKVTDETGEPLTGVNVLIKGTMTGTMTDLDGRYSIPSVKQGAVLVFSSIGFATQEIKVGSSAVINAVLKNDTEFLDDVVVVAYGTARRKDLTGSLSEVKSEIVAIQNTSTVSRALEGSAPGLSVASVDGQPGFDMAIRLRGTSSTNGKSAAALIVIDGVAQQMVDTYENPLSQLNPEDIASVSVLKDAASTALYGSRAANGVILITTKKGQEGRAKISFQSRWGWNSLGNYDVSSIDNAAQYYEYAWQSIYNSYRYGVNGTGAPGTKPDGTFYTNAANPNHSDAEAREFASQHLFNYYGSETAFQRNALNNNLAYRVPGAVYTKDMGVGQNQSSTMSGAYLVNPDGRINPDASLLYKGNGKDLLISNAFRQQYNLSASGGTEKVQYYASLGYQDEPSYLRSSEYNRYSGRMSVDAQVLKWMKIGANVGYAKTNTRAQAGKWGPRQIGAASGNAMLWVKGWTPIAPVFEMDANGNYVLDAKGEKIVNVNNKSYSPLGQAKSEYSSDYAWLQDINIERIETSVWTTRLYSDVRFLKYFDFNVAFNMDQQMFKRTAYMNGLAGRATGTKGSFGVKAQDRTVINTQQILSYNQDFGKHHADAMVGHEYEQLDRMDINWGSTYELIPGLAIPGNFVNRYTTYGAQNSWTPYYGNEAYRTESYFGRANYNYAGRYYLSASARRDGSSKFTAKNRWGNFWSVGGSWRLSEEPFMENAKSWLDNAKIRTSYGVTGNANGLTTWYLNQYWNYAQSAWQSSTSGTGVADGTSVSSANSLIDENLTWENVHQFDLGVDMSVLKSRITASVDFYNNLTDNAFYNRTVSPLASAGNATKQQNAAQVRNRGIELELSADVIRTSDLTLNVTVNGTHYRTILAGVPDEVIPAWDETMDVPEGTWIVASEDMAAAGTADHAGRGTTYLRGVGRDLFNLYFPKYAGVDEYGLPTYWHRVTYNDVNNGDHGGRYAGKKVGENVVTNVASDASFYEVGSATPDWMGGMTINLKYKNFDVSVVSAYQIGGKIYSREYSTYLYAGSTLGSTNIPVSKKLIGKTWTPENSGAYFPMQWFPSGSTSSLKLDGSYVGTTGSHDYTDMSLFNASYFRLKNITMGYTFPKKFTSKVNISALRVFASADNLLIFSAAKGVDPTLSIIGGKEVDTYVYPQMQTLTFGVNLDF
ncbi:MAG: SusC/RagA family TonB-linked outer membrane protein [Bacteroidales bacterium]|nr:SusC/RagA family TonB-linked outer membrane protein [Candidatus Cryptobacteroides onthequi]